MANMINGKTKEICKNFNIKTTLLGWGHDSRGRVHEKKGEE
jgi:hypothetical protein